MELEGNQSDSPQLLGALASQMVGALAVQVVEALAVGAVMSIVPLRALMSMVCMAASEALETRADRALLSAPAEGAAVGLGRLRSWRRWRSLQGGLPGKPWVWEIQPLRTQWVQWG